ncbi:Predicted nucleic acid-binding protein, contains PIN domain [Microbacterium azadirachtae]|uniref:Ribonuclease VapC n=1 Tax=Microbacterium azadirachtae TaxID=582680 RepID=A0A1I6HX39_9MICO|nr:type II toxin-antitoxin system VapC family toxin [Microbacterium azadirachtae]SFR58780.1 Predicted nucleic acid-binding protein, contains PIN domain [Microbacterium azadirachtae]
MIYLDTSAAIKAIVPEQGTDEMRDVFARGEQLIASRLLALELAAVTQRRRAGGDEAARILDRVNLVTLDDQVLDRAMEIRSGLRAPDALHLATALQLEGVVDSLLSFDRELRERAREAGIPPHPLCADAG